MVIVNEVVGSDSITKTDVIQKYFAHLVVNGMVPKYLFDLNNVYQRHEVLTNVQTSLITHLTNSHLKKIKIVKDIVSTFTSSKKFA
jgi:hypothetical protein